MDWNWTGPGGEDYHYSYSVPPQALESVIQYELYGWFNGIDIYMGPYAYEVNDPTWLKYDTYEIIDPHSFFSPPQNIADTYGVLVRFENKFWNTGIWMYLLTVETFFESTPAMDMELKVYLDTDEDPMNGLTPYGPIIIQPGGGVSGSHYYYNLYNHYPLEYVLIDPQYKYFYVGFENLPQLVRTGWHYNMYHNSYCRLFKAGDPIYNGDIFDASVSPLSNEGGWRVGAYVSATPQNIAVTVPGGIYTPVITWDKYPHATSYNIYRATEPDAEWPGDWDEVELNWIPTDLDYPIWIDLYPGPNEYYRVTANF